MLLPPTTTQTQSQLPNNASLVPRRKRFLGLASSMGGSGAFTPSLQPATGAATSIPNLPANYGFGDLAGYEEARRNQFGQQSQQDILGQGQVLGQLGQDLRGQIQTNQGQLPGLYAQNQSQLGTDYGALQNQIQAGTDARQQAINRVMGDYGQQAGQQRGQLEGTYSDLEKQFQGNTAAGRQAVQDYAGQYGQTGTQRRTQLAQNLADVGQQQFSMANPGILEDLNRRGLASSPDAVARAQADALKQISLQNQQQLLDYDTRNFAEQDRLGQLGLDQTLGGIQNLNNVAVSRQQGLSGFDQNTFNQQNQYRQQGLDAQLAGQNELGNAAKDVFSRRQALAQGLLDQQTNGVNQLSDLDKQLYQQQVDTRGNALSANLQAQQDALDSGLDLRRGGLDAQRADAQAAQEQALAEKLAKEQGRNSITGSLIGAGGSLLGGALSNSGGLGRLFGGVGGSAAGAGGAGGLAGAGGLGGSAGLGGIGSALLPVAGIGAGLVGGGYAGQALGNSIFKSNKAESRARTGASIGAGVGTAAGTILGGPAGSALGGLAGGAIGQAYGGLTASHPASQLSEQAKNLISQPGKTIANTPKNVAKTISKAFCFDASTPITMSDGSTKSVHRISLGDSTKGGDVESIRISKTGDGTRYKYFGITLTGSHAVLEHGIWKRVEDSKYSIPIPGDGIVYSLVTSKNRVYVHGIEMADEHETPYYEDLTIDQSLDYLNAEQSGKTIEEIEHAI